MHTRSNRWLRITLVAALAAGLLVAGSSIGDAAPRAGGNPSGGEDFYADIPSGLGAFAPGEVIKWERERHLWPSLTDLSAYRVMFRSDGQLGGPVAETGMVFVPDGAAPAGGWTVVAWGHGTSGVGDSCAPSKYPSMYPTPWGVYANEIARLVHQGHIVVAPDYEGLGTPGRHTYLQTDAQANAMIDGVRAARQIAVDAAGTSADTSWAAIGHSQGGQAAIGASELAQDRAPELDLVGAVGLAPSMMLETAIEAIAADAYNFPYIGYIGAGIAATHPGFRYGDFLGPQMLPIRWYAQEECFDSWFPALHTYYKPGVHRNLARGWDASADVQDYFADSEIGMRTSDSPVLIEQGKADGLYQVLRAQVRRMCRKGSVVAWDAYPGVTHDQVVAASWRAVRHWLKDRFAGDPAPNVC